MKLTMRPYQSEDDYWLIRTFLRELYLFNGRRERAWQTYRFDYWRWHAHENIEHFQLEEALFLWETPEGRVAAVLNPEGKGEAFFQVHPAFRTPELDREMLEVAEQRLAVATGQDKNKLIAWVHTDDHARQELMTNRGYAQGKWKEFQRRRPLGLPIPEITVAPGYTIRALGDIHELPARSWLSWVAFHPDEPDEKYEGWDWYHNVQRAPLYRRDLDIVAVAPDGELAAFCTLWFDDVTRTAAFEPVGTAPHHQRRGLGKAVMYEGMRRAKHLGATLATVGSYSAEAGALYEAVGFGDYDLSEMWSREW